MTLLSAPLVRAVSALAALAVLGGCQVAGPTAAAPVARRVAAMGVRSADDAALVRQLALQAHAALREIDATYASLKLNTPTGRRFTPQQEATVREGVGPALDKLAVTAAAIGDALGKEAGGKQVQAFASRYAGLAPVQGSDAPPSQSATALLFRVSQYRVKLGAVLDFALEAGFLTELPRAEAPASKPRAS